MEKFLKQEILNQINASSSPIKDALKDSYDLEPIGAEDFLSQKLSRVESLITSFQNEDKIIITRCPGRISFSKHSDYINNDLIYLADDRDTFCASSLITNPTDNRSGKLILINEASEYSNVEFSLEDLSLGNKESWDFYIRKLLSLLFEKIEKPNDFGLVLSYNSEIPSGSGLSSSHALIVSTLINLFHSFDLKPIEENTTDPQKLMEILRLCQEVEKARGFNSGLGDQAAQLLSQKGKLLCTKLFPKLEHSYAKIPKELGIISAPSFIKADKSLPEFQEANENIKRYKELNSIYQEVDYLGDLLYKLTEQEILESLKDLDPKLQGPALYGLAEGVRTKDLKERFFKEEPENTLTRTLGEHLNKSHKAEQNFEFKESNWRAIEKPGYTLDPKLALKDHIGRYGASTLANDQLQYYANQIEGVYGSSISGAGLGGSNTIVFSKENNNPNKKETKKLIIEELIKNFYSKNAPGQKAQDESKEIHVNISTNAASRLS